MNSRDGARGERGLAHHLTDRGYPARRGQQFSGSPDSPDMVCDRLDGWHIECKCTEPLDLVGAMAQAVRDAAGKRPLVAHPTQPICVAGDADAG